MACPLPSANTKGWSVSRVDSIFLAWYPAVYPTHSTTTVWPAGARHRRRRGDPRSASRTGWHEGRRRGERGVAVAALGALGVGEGGGVGARAARVAARGARARRRGWRVGRWSRGRAPYPDEGRNPRDEATATRRVAVARRGLEGTPRRFAAFTAWVKAFMPVDAVRRAGESGRSATPLTRLSQSTTGTRRHALLGSRDMCRKRNHRATCAEAFGFGTSRREGGATELPRRTRRAPRVVHLGVMGPSSARSPRRFLATTW